MPAPSSAFSHHPELEGKITDPRASFFRNFNIATVFSEKPELQWVLDELRSDSDREDSRMRTLADHRGGDLWVFAYGSLMWDPAFHFAEVRRATVPGYERRFVLKHTYGARGTREAPGLMAALDHGDCCEGLVFRIAAQDIETETEILWRREMIGHAYKPIFVAATLGDQTITALAFAANHSSDVICPDLTREEQICFIASGAGFLGTSMEYLGNIVSQFAALGVVDEDCSALLQEVEDYLAKPT
ncbi:gamma-glutamylcyclotransferase [Pelagibius sp. Alg239-R121]|uniref:gamma-glutamylcyclotransferase n=1 Tax=Pelagibius sp. Alg239-R121 TaxID=2993448 RepID=UPI0024A65D77|nr:gamma-glutamylcyclotransferase [Pelagibius sp. Alg239-R121]